MNLDKQVGVSIMKITEELDTGPVMKKIEIDISSSDTAGLVSEKLSKIGSEYIVEALNDIFNEKKKFVEQDHNSATYAKKIKKIEGRIDWKERAKNIIGKINGLNPSPGAWFEYKNIRYKIWKASIYDKVGPPGTIMDNNFIICCQDKSIKIIEIQREGKNKLLLKDFLLRIHNT
jgi:methionyl-tRNA formyltransferase